MRLLRPIFLGALFRLLSATCIAQSISGSLEFDSNAAWPNNIRLYRTSGTAHIELDSAIIDASGNFRFPTRPYPIGYYRIGFADDQVDLILGEDNDELVLRFAGRPLQSGIAVSGSVTNQRLWEYKFASREMQQRVLEIGQQRAALDPHDQIGLERLAEQEAAAKERLLTTLERLVAQAPESYFTKVVRTDERVLKAIQDGPVAVRSAMDWSDPSLTRSSVYPRAIMALLQSATPATSETLQAASDSLLHWASNDSTCWCFARRNLVEIFSTYGPPDVVQHLVDRYVAGPMALFAPDAALLGLVAEQLQVAVGAVGADLDLPIPGEARTDRLYDLLRRKQVTALFFYSSTCDHCHAEMPGLNSVYAAFRDRGFGLIGIALDDNIDDFHRNILEQELNFPCYSELNAWGSVAAKAYAVKATPTLIVLDTQGRIVQKPYDHQALNEFLELRLAR